MKLRKKFKLGAFIVFFLLSLTSSTFAEQGAFSIGAIGGWAGSIVDEAVKGFPYTDFESSPVYGASLLYRFPNGFGLDLCVEHFEMDLVELGNKFGTLKMTPLMLLLKYQGMPKDARGLTGHFDIGGGINFTSFEKGPFVTGLERTYRVQYTIDTDNSFIFEIGGGLDYFFFKNLSMNLDARLLIGNVGTTWKVSAAGPPTAIQGIDTFHVSNFQILLGLRFWF